MKKLVSVVLCLLMIAGIVTIGRSITPCPRA